MKRLWQKFSNQKKPEPITIVSGLPRSGTSMMMKMLDSGGISPIVDNIRTPDEDNPKGYYEFERVKKLKEGDTVWLADAQGKAVKVIAALLVYLPATYDYRIIFMRRAIPEILASQQKMLIRRGEDPHKISDEQLTSLFEKHLSQVNAWIDSQPNVKRIDIDYGQIVSDPAPSLEAINRFLDNELDVEAMHQVVDPTLYRQRRTNLSVK